jgi:yecA family protein
MDIPLNKYCGDKKMAELLKKTGAKLSISGVYGLFYGCLAGPELVMPSRYMLLILGEEYREFESMEKVERIYGNLMSLWNLLSGWKPEREPCLFPDIEYPDNYGGLVQRLQYNYSLVEQFIKGLDIGSTEESDFSKDGLKALEDLSKTSVMVQKYAEVIEKEKAENEKDITEELNYTTQMENMLADCIVRINLGLKDARMRVVEEMRMLSNHPSPKSKKISRNSPCPCGSGKKYKKCCGLEH